MLKDKDKINFSVESLLIKALIKSAKTKSYKDFFLNKKINKTLRAN